MARCTRIKNSGDQCGNNARIGATLCAKHGGNAPNVQKAIARRRAEEAARKALADAPLWSNEDPAVENPIEEMALSAGRLKGAIERQIARMAQVEECFLCGREPNDSVDHKITMELSKELNRLTESMARIGIEDRRVQLERLKIEIMVEALKAGLAAVGVDESTNESQTILAREAALARVSELEAKGFTYVKGEVVN